MDGTNVVAGNVFPDIEDLAGVVALAVLHQIVGFRSTHRHPGQDQLQLRFMGKKHRPDLRKGFDPTPEELQKIPHLRPAAGNADFAALLRHCRRFIAAFLSRKRQEENLSRTAAEHGVFDFQLHQNALGNEKPSFFLHRQDQGDRIPFPPAGVDGKIHLQPLRIQPQKKPHSRPENQQEQKDTEQKRGAEKENQQSQYHDQQAKAYPTPYQSVLLHLSHRRRIRLDLLQDVAQQLPGADMIDPGLRAQHQTVSADVAEDPLDVLRDHIVPFF